VYLDKGGRREKREGGWAWDQEKEEVGEGGRRRGGQDQLFYFLDRES
jgi:hypothetical protein